MPAAQRVSLIKECGVDLVIDVGANTGQYAKALRARGFTGRIQSFEPLPDAFAELLAAAGNDPNWEVRNEALGPMNAQIEFNVSGDGVCSSPLLATAGLTTSIPQSTTVGTTTVSQARLDEVALPAERVLLKIDTQGYEHHVLDGATQTLSRTVALDVEMALVELYEGGSSIYDLLPRLHREGFSVVSIESGFVDPRTSQTLDVDVLLIRNE